MGVNLLMRRDRVFRLRNVQIWAVPSSKLVDLPSLRIRICGMRNVQVWAVPVARGRIVIV